jgi:serine protease AprX
VGITWNSVGGGVTWDGPTRGAHKRFAVGALALATIAGVAATPHASAATTPLPDLASVEQSVGAQQAWQAGANGQGIDVAVLDTGVTPVPGLDGKDKLVNGPDLSFDSQNENTRYLDGYGHGTAMASIIAGNDGTSGGFQGVAPNARIVNVKVGASNGASDVSQIIAGIDWVTQHAHDSGMNIRVLNVSLGTDSTQYYASDPLATAAENAWKHGIVVVAATGNENTGNAVADPATDPYVLAVAAADPVGTVNTSDDQVPSWSNRGTGVRQPDLVAPGAYVMGLNVPGSTLATQNPNAVFGRYLRGSGTSQATAITSGAAADVLSAHPDYTPDQVKAALTRSATRISVNNPNKVGNGELNIPGALTASVSNATQSFANATGVGTLEGARGSNHVSLGGVSLTGEKDIFGNTWTSATMALAEAAGATWSGGIYNGATWSGATWSGATWSGATWSGATWSGATWSGATWSGATWSGATWSGATWSGATWSGATWSGATWSGATWSGATWSGATWSSATWS